MHTAHLGGNKRRTVVWHPLVTFIWNYKILKFKELKKRHKHKGGKQGRGKNKNKSYFDFLPRVCESLKTMSKYFFIILHD